MNRFAVYFTTGKAEIFDAEDVELRDGCVVLYSVVGDAKVVEAFFPPGIVSHVKRHADITPAPVHTPPVSSSEMIVPFNAVDHDGELSYSLRQASAVLGISTDTLQERCRSGFYPNAWKLTNSGKRGNPPWMIPLTDLGVEYHRQDVLSEGGAVGTR